MPAPRVWHNYSMPHTRSTNVVVRKKKTFLDDSLFQSALRARVAYLDGHKHIETTRSLCNPKRHRTESDTVNMRKSDNLSPILWIMYLWRKSRHNILGFEIEVDCEIWLIGKVLLYLSQVRCSDVLL